jgi:translation initiation factor IF-2
MAMARKGKGLRIVKKKRPNAPAPVEKKIETRSDADETVSLYGKKKVAADLAETEEKKKKAKKSTAPASKKETGIKIDVLADRNLSDSYYDDEENEVMLPDLTVALRKDEEEAPKRPMNKMQQQQQQQRRTLGTRTGQRFQPGNISRGKRKKRRKPVVNLENEVVKSIEIPEDTRVYEFAEAINKPISEVIKALFTFGMMVTKNDFLDKDSIEVLAEEFEVDSIRKMPSKSWIMSAITTRFKKRSKAKNVRLS